MNCEMLVWSQLELVFEFVQSEKSIIDENKNFYECIFRLIQVEELVLAGLRNFDVLDRGKRNRPWLEGTSPNQRDLSSHSFYARSQLGSMAPNMKVHKPDSIAQHKFAELEQAWAQI